MGVCAFLLCVFCVGLFEGELAPHFSGCAREREAAPGGAFFFFFVVRILKTQKREKKIF